MSWQIAAHIRAASADWDVEAALQKELDAVSVCSHISSHSSATGIVILCAKRVQENFVCAFPICSRFCSKLFRCRTEMILLECPALVSLRR